MKRTYVDENTIALMLAGSNAYGTNTPESDLDLRGVMIPRDKEYYMGFQSHFEQYSESEPEDLTIYDMRKAFHLISNCNPNMVELLFTDEKYCRVLKPEWRKVMEHRDKFISKKARYTYTGYAFAQLKRIKTARNWLLNPPKKKPERLDFGLPEKRLVSKDELGAFQWILVNLLKGSLDHLNLSDSTKEELASLDLIGQVQSRGIPDDAFPQIQRATGASDEWMHIMQMEQGYNNAKRHWDSYQSWKKGRNKHRAELEVKFGYDTKHASHLVRLMRMGKEILETGKVVVFRPDREELLAIRNGAWSYEQIEEYAEKMQQEIIAVYETSTLRDKPDRVFLDKLCAEIIEEYING
jgi:predicted nucleotidyltransferase